MSKIHLGKKAKRIVRAKPYMGEPCIVCGKPVVWGVNGCPMIRKGQEMLALLGGGWEYMKHYACEIPKESSLK